MSAWIQLCFGYSEQRKLKAARRRLQVVIATLNENIACQNLTEKLERNHCRNIARYNVTQARELLVTIKHNQKARMRCVQCLAGLNLLLGELHQAELNQLTYVTMASANSVLHTMQKHVNPDLIRAIMDETRDIIAINEEIQTTLCETGEDSDWSDALEEELTTICGEVMEEKSMDVASIAARQETPVPRRNVFATRIDQLSAV